MENAAASVELEWPKPNQNQLASSDSTIDGLRWLKNGVARRALMSQTRAIIDLMRLNFLSVFNKIFQCWKNSFTILIMVVKLFMELRKAVGMIDFLNESFLRIFIV